MREIAFEHRLEGLSVSQVSPGWGTNKPSYPPRMGSHHVTNYIWRSTGKQKAWKELQWKEVSILDVRASQLLGICLEVHMELGNLRSSPKQEFRILMRKCLWLGRGFIATVICSWATPGTFHPKTWLQVSLFGRNGTGGMGWHWRSYGVTLPVNTTAAHWTNICCNSSSHQKNSLELRLH